MVHRQHRICWRWFFVSNLLVDFFHSSQVCTEDQNIVSFVLFICLLFLWPCLEIVSHSFLFIHRTRWKSSIFIKYSFNFYPLKPVNKTYPHVNRNLAREHIYKPRIPGKWSYSRQERKKQIYCVTNILMMLTYLLK